MIKRDSTKRIYSTRGSQQFHTLSEGEIAHQFKKIPLILWDILNKKITHIWPVLLTHNTTALPPTLCRIWAAVKQSLKLGRSYPVTGPGRPRGRQHLEAPKIFSRHMKVARLSDLCIARLYHQGKSLVLMSLRGWVDTRTIERPDWISQWRIWKTSPWIKPATLRLDGSASTNCATAYPKTVFDTLCTINAWSWVQSAVQLN